MAIIEHTNLDRRQYNQPNPNEVAVLIPSDNNIQYRDVVLTTKQGDLQSIHDLHPAYDCLAYPIFGSNLGFQMNIQHNRDARSQTIREFYAYRLHQRPNEFNIFLHGGRLFHQYIVDQYAKVEHNNIRYLRNNQSELRAEVYRGLQDQIHGDLNPNRPIGRRIVLPSSFAGGPRHMHQLFQDAMTIVAKHSKPALFITMTCNPNWQEILDALEPNQMPNDRPDIVGRVFKQNLNALMEDITKKGIFGKCIAHVNVIEFQKRGLPHAHILIILAPDQQIDCIQSIDHAVSAELPDPTTQPELYIYTGGKTQPTWTMWISTPQCTLHA